MTYFSLVSMLGTMRLSLNVTIIGAIIVAIGILGTFGNQVISQGMRGSNETMMIEGNMTEDKMMMEGNMTK